MAKKYIGIWQTLNVIERLQKKEKKEYGLTAVTFALERAKSYIKNLPAADVQEVKHGQWIDDGCLTCCSVCGQHSIMDFETPYCQWCGVKMDGKDGEQR